MRSAGGTTRRLRIGVLGAGIAGTCAALELAARGREVDLYDEHPEPVRGASLNSEGKIHLGLVYARDPSLRTARTMILGALHFADCLRRWIDVRADDLALSTPYLYAVHRGTMASPDELEIHYARCAALFAETVASSGRSYLGADRTLLAERLSPREMGNAVAGDRFVAAYRTSERAIDPRAVAEQLRSAVAASPRIRFRAATRVRGVARRRDGRLDVALRQDGVDRTETHDHVVNALWHGMLPIDAGLGLQPERQWIYRYKIGGWLPGPVDAGAVPSATFVLGPYGDLVNFGARGLYLSWYPEGLVGTSLELVAPDWDATLSSSDRQGILKRSFEELAVRCPALAALGYDEERAQPVGGVILAWGETDIDDGGSRLHTRHEIGIRTAGAYHSVNTGKYTMGPYLGLRVADRIDEAS